MRFKIDPEFEKMIPPLTRDEFRQLEENMLEEGRIHTPIIVWDDIIAEAIPEFLRFNIVECNVRDVV